MTTAFQFHRRDKVSSLDPEVPLFFGLHVPSNAASATAHDLSNTLAEMLRRTDPASGRIPSSRGQTSKLIAGAERLYEALATAKIMTSKVSMHLDSAWRRTLFLTLDKLLDADDWHDDDEPLNPQSFETYLRFILLIRPSRDPSLGISNAGNLLAGWTDGRNRLSMELLPHDSVRWVLVRYLDDERETAAAQIALPRLAQALSPYQPERWLFDDRASSTR